MDRICSNYADLFLYIRGLLDFWYQHNSRLTNIKAKIFLRSDLYNSKALQFVDASKMRAYQLTLSWDTVSLYRLLVKRMANAGVSELTAYLLDVPGLLIQAKDSELGYMPSALEEAYQGLIDKIIGKYMGKTPKRGISYVWVPNHIQDANGQCRVPLAEVSADRVRELVNEEYQWLQGLINRLKGNTMLMEREEFLGYLSPELWHKEEQDRLPGRTGEEILTVLLDLGIVMQAADGRINVPELYLYGFGLKRKGGIKRPKQNRL